MPRPDVDQLDEQIERLRNGGTLTENEVKVLCDKVRSLCCSCTCGVVLECSRSATFGGQSELFIANEPCACDDY